MEVPSFEAFADFIRDWAQLHDDQEISPDTQFERDLGITGGDGTDLIEAVANKFGLEFSAESFDLRPNEFLFNAEGWDLLGVFWRSLRRKPEPEVRSFTVGELWDALSKK